MKIVELKETIDGLYEYLNREESDVYRSLVGKEDGDSHQKRYLLEKKASQCKYIYLTKGLK